MLDEGERRIRLLAEAVETLEPSQSLVELLHALVDLGAALRCAGRRQEARGPWNGRLTSPAQKGRRRWRCAPGRSCWPPGHDRAERRYVGSRRSHRASYASPAWPDGLRNREIAEALVVSRKTVDYHLNHVYQKLGVGREGLAETLAAAKD